MPRSKSAGHEKGPLNSDGSPSKRKSTSSHNSSSSSNDRVGGNGSSHGSHVSSNGGARSALAEPLAPRDVPESTRRIGLGVPPTFTLAESDIRVAREATRRNFSVQVRRRCQVLVN
jgi:hypothetical protein